MIIAFILMFTVTFIIVYHLRKYRNPYKLYMVFGKKGSGKSTLMTKLALRYTKKGFKVYCNTYIPSTYYFNTDDIGIYHFPENSVLLIDEVGMIWDNREFKNFKPHVRDYFKYQRHYKHIVYLFSQSFDIDKKLRDLTDHMYLIMNFFNCFSIARRITKTITITHGDKNYNGESKLIDDLRFDPLLLFFLGTVRVTYIPKYVKYFNSYSTKKLQHKNYEFIPLPPKQPFRVWAARLPRRCATAATTLLRNIVRRIYRHMHKK